MAAPKTLNPRRTLVMSLDPRLDRRQFLRRAAAGAAVVAFVPSSRSWVAEAEPPPGSVPLPELDGELILEGEVLDQAADDFGHLVSRHPFAVLRPGSVRDVVKMVRFARAQNLQVAGMGAVGDSHSTFGQAQAEAGVVIDMATLAAVHEVGPHSVTVDAGASWLEVLEATLPFGLSPPTLTDYLGLRVGGTLSVGGIGGQAFRSGFQADNVLELQVVTGRGELVTCSRRERPVLFHAVRAGLGQFAVIVRARLRLVEVPPETRTYLALYADLETFTRDQERLLRDGRFDYVEGQAVPADGGGWLFLLEAVKYFDPASPPDDGALTGDLSFLPGTLTTEDRSYLDFANRLAPLVELLIKLGIWALPHPWLNGFVPARAAVPFLQSVLDEETLETTGQGPILIYPCRARRSTAPFLRLPEGPVFYLLSILRNAIPPTDPADQVARNREIYDRLAAVGGKRYPIGSVPFSRADWRQHFGPRFRLLALAKRFFDPDNVLTPGQGIFHS
jgi:FAD/FMN-containing dehydrogenase